jgi:hypothetical protein
MSSAAFLIAAKRDKRISAVKLRASQLAIRGLKPETLAIEIDAAVLIDLSRRYHLQGYDAVYFELARRLAIPIASLEEGIEQHARCLASCCCDYRYDGKAVVSLTQLSVGVLPRQGWQRRQGPILVN